MTALDAASLRLPGPTGDLVSVHHEPLPGEIVAAPEWREHLGGEGYAIGRGLLSREECRELRDAFAAEVRSHSGFLYRQTTGRPERHAFTPGGFLANPLINIQDLRERDFPRFRAAALAAITHERVTDAVTRILGEPGIVIQTMCFEGNPATPAHQDCYYLDSTRRGEMIAAWIALEDIHPGAGRFFVVPGSARLDMPPNAGPFEMAAHHDRYQAAVVERLRASGLPCSAPALAAGDVLFWSSRTIHGSLVASELSRSRLSLTAHFIPASTQFLQLERRIVPTRLQRINGVGVHVARPQDEMRHRAVLEMAGRFPRAYTLAKRCAVRALGRAGDAATSAAAGARRAP